jgi:hypothetical protein
MTELEDNVKDLSGSRVMSEIDRVLIINRNSLPVLETWKQSAFGQKSFSIGNGLRQK